MAGFASLFTTKTFADALSFAATGKMPNANAANSPTAAPAQAQNTNMASTSRASKQLSSGADLGLGDQISQQLAEQEDERKKKLLGSKMGVGATDTLGLGGY